MTIEKNYIQITKTEFAFGIVLAIAAIIILSYLFARLWPECQQLFI